MPKIGECFDKNSGFRVASALSNGVQSCKTFLAFSFQAHCQLTGQKPLVLVFNQTGLA